MPATQFPHSREHVARDELADLFGFTPDELALNRAGKFSARQRQTVRYTAIGHLVRGVALVIFGAGALLMFAPQAHTARDRVLAGLLAGLLLVIVALLVVSVRRVWFPAVYTATGSLRRGDDPWHPAVHVGDTTLRISTRRWRRLASTYPGIYCAYHDPLGRLLSIEPVEKEPEP